MMLLRGILAATLVKAARPHQFHRTPPRHRSRHYGMHLPNRLIHSAPPPSADQIRYEHVLHSRQQPYPVFATQADPRVQAPNDQYLQWQGKQARSPPMAIPSRRPQTLHLMHSQQLDHNVIHHAYDHSGIQTGYGTQRQPLAPANVGHRYNVPQRAWHQIQSQEPNYFYKPSTLNAKVKDFVPFDFTSSAEKILLPVDQLLLAGYPPVGAGGYAVYRAKRTDHNAIEDIVALDCEMVYDRKDKYTRVKLLAKITVCDKNGDVIYEELVKNDYDSNTYYATKWSGMTEEILANATKRLPEIQWDLTKIIGKDTIIVVHGGENDLGCMRVAHNRVIDTALCSHFRWSPSNGFNSRKLKDLTKEFLEITIQEQTHQFGQPQGHDPAEDARAALALAKLWARNPAAPKKVDLSSSQDDEWWNEV